MQDMCEAFMEGDVEKALNLQLEVQETNRPSILRSKTYSAKAALAEMKYIENELNLPPYTYMEISE